MSKEMRGLALKSRASNSRACGFSTSPESSLREKHTDKGQGTKRQHREEDRGKAEGCPNVGQLQLGKSTVSEPAQGGPLGNMESGENSHTSTGARQPIHELVG